jgi:hypothetical protein
MATVDLGKISFVNKGTYAAGTTYEERDVVQFTDSGELSSYVYVNGTPAAGQTPSSGGTVNSSHWSKFAGGVSLSLGNNKIVTTDGSGNLTGTAIGSVDQVVKVTGTNTLGFGSGFSALSDGHLFFDNAGAHGPAGPSANSLALRYIDQPLISGASFGNLATDGAGSQIWTVYEAGTYYMELAGAMGGGNGGGGHGGIVWGQKTLAVGDKLYIRVGQMGNIGQSTSSATPITNPYDTSRFSNSNTSSTSYGGYGGSKGGQSSQFAGSGGGSTDVRLRLANGNNFAGATFSDAIADRMAVAGAGGGCYIEATSGSSHTGWYGGGEGGGTVGSGGQGQSSTSRGGTQSGGGTSDHGSTGTQAQGGNAYTSNDAGGGGGGYWGGGGGADNGAGGGGSGYLGGFNSNTGGYQVGGNSGMGYVKIRKL